jgi:hypothetical protein
VIVNNFNVLGAAVTPTKANPPLLVDADRVLSGPIAPECFKPIAGRRTKVIQIAGSGLPPPWLPAAALAWLSASRARA